MVNTINLRLQLIQAHQHAIEELETTYISFISTLLQRKKGIILEMQRKFYEQMENIHNLDKSYNISILINPQNQQHTAKKHSNCVSLLSDEEENNNTRNNTHSISQLSTPPINPSMQPSLNNPFPQTQLQNNFNTCAESQNYSHQNLTTEINNTSTRTNTQNINTNTNPTQYSLWSDNTTASRRNSRMNIRKKANINKNKNKNSTIIAANNRIPKWNCAYCKYSSTNRNDLENHIGVHTTVKAYKCGICGRCFRAKNDLEKHVTFHVDDTVFKCNYCEKLFQTKQDLIVHMLTHESAKPFQCEICKKRFSKPSQAQNHIRKQHPEIIFTPLCSVHHC